MTIATLPRSFDDAVLHVEHDMARLVGGWCPDCRQAAFPLTPVCPRCGAGTRRRLLAAHGVVYARAIINAPVTIYPSPTTIVQVDVDGVRVGGMLRSGDGRIGATVTIAPLFMDSRGEQVTAYCFDQQDPPDA
jgi:uncharacterized OB-fold protein